MDAWEIEFIIRDDNGDHLIHRTIEFPFGVDAHRLDEGIHDLLMKMAIDDWDQPTEES